MVRKKKEEEEEPTTPEDALKIALKAIDKTYGKGTVILGGTEAVPGVEFISSGCAAVDRALGGGWAKGRIIEVIGPGSAGKSTLCLHAIAEVQKNGGRAAYIDVEHAFDPEYAKNIGVNVNELIFSQPNSGEQALNVSETLIRTGAVSLLIVDSVAALVPQKEIEGQVGDASMGLQARIMSQAMRKMCGIVHDTNTTVIFINQIRMKFVLFGSPEVGAGGEALKFYASQRVDIRRIGTEKEGDEVVANKTRVKVIKNKVAPPFKEAEFFIRYGVGIDKYQNLIDTAMEEGIIVRSGPMYLLFNEKFKGIKALGEFVRNNPDIVERIKERLNGN